MFHRMVPILVMTRAGPLPYGLTPLLCGKSRKVAVIKSDSQNDIQAEAQVSTPILKESESNEVLYAW